MSSDEEFSPHTNGRDVVNNGPAVPRPKPQKVLSVEKMYQKKSQLEHILLRPDTYIGSVERVTEQMWVMDGDKGIMVQKEISYVPGLYKIFDEILVNAADNKQRDPKMDCIKININKESNIISIWNNGKGIPVVEHKDEKMFVPTMIFGHLLTSSNYNDEEEKVTGGRNGYGAKLCNIFSKKFTVETSSKEYRKQLKQTWTNNMSGTKDPTIQPMTSSDDFTKITFSPDLAKFKMTELEDDIIQLMERRAYDVAASTRGVKVYLNSERLKIKNFKEYCELFIKDKEDDAGNPLKVVYESVNDRWEVAMCISDMGFQQVSFVNSIATTKGGRHVDHVCDLIVKELAAHLKKKSKNTTVRPFQVKNQMFLFLNCLVVNPTFDSQTKENMTLQAKSFGSKCSLSPKFHTAVTKTGIVESILTMAKIKEESKLQKTGGKKTNKLKGIPKLEDANDAGTKNSIHCTLILTEGDSAKTLAVAGLGVVGRDRYGVFPLRGKVLNVREASLKQIMENAEINHIMKIVGLQHKKKYDSMDDLKSLRYGKLMIMTDQDQDGSHIKGLLINFIHFFWPSLLRLPFLEEFITPIVKATKGNEENSFYSLPEFEEWKKETPNWPKYRVKYYKGLGTSTSNEAKEYFSDMARHRVKFSYKGTDDDSNICLAFSKKEVERRKEWLTNWMESCKRRQELGLPEEYLYGKATKAINYSEFINKELVLFSNTDNERSIPCVVDGLKPGQRKVMYTCMKRNDKREVKVAQLAGSVAEQSSYHHGEASLMSTIINLAQNFVGSNNINLLLPNGQFGTRLQGGKDAASPRYIFTMLNPLTKMLFNASDSPLLNNLYDDNQKIEPRWYIPIIPMILVNGADGIGTGWMTKIVNYNPRDIVESMKRMMRGDEPLLLKPWYKNHRGELESLGDSRYMSYGEVAILDDDKVEISELPILKWTQDYKDSVLEPMMNPPGDKGTPLITDYKDYTTDTTVRFLVTLTPENLIKAEATGLHKFFKLQTTLTTGSMVAFDDMGVLRKYSSVQDIMKEFFKLRLEYYVKRKAYMVGVLEAESLKLSNQARFIVEKCSNKIVVENKKKAAMIQELQARGYDPDPERAWRLRISKDALLEEDNDRQTEADASDEQDGAAIEYSYLLGMAMWSLTLERKEKLLRDRDEKLQELKDLQVKTTEDLWTADLDAFLELLEKCEEEERKKEREAGNKTKAGKMKGDGKGKPPARAAFKVGALETLPSEHGRRVVPTVDEETKKRVEKLDAAKLRPPGEKAGRKKKCSDKVGGEEKDELDLLIQGSKKPLKDRVGNSPESIAKKMSKKGDGMKQTKLNFGGKKGPPKKRKTWDSDEESESGTEPDYSSDESFEKKITAPRKAKTESKTRPLESDSDLIISDDEPDPPKTASSKPSSDQMFDDLIFNSSGSQENDGVPPTEEKRSHSSSSVSDDEPKKKKAPKKRQLLAAADKPEKKKATKRKAAKIDSDSDLDIFVKSKKTDAGSESEFDDSFEELAPRATTGRARKPVNYNLGDDDSD